MSRMETYPASISLGEESAEMWNLNKRLEAYLSRVKALEEENELLRAEIHQLKGTRSKKSLVRNYHDEMMKLRDALDDGLQEMVQVETDRDSIFQEIEYVKELCLQEKQAQEDVKKELSDSKRLLEEENRAQIWLKERLIQLEQEVEDILKAHEEDKALMEEEISSYSQRLENVKIAPTNFKPVNVEDYANKLSQIWQGAVEEYKNEVSVLETNLSQAKDNLKKVLDENKQSQLLLQNLDRELQSLKGRKEMLEELLAKQWVEQQDEENRLQLEIESLEKEKQDLRVQIAQVLEDRQQLMNLKMSLCLEVATYRSLLEAESTRLYTPSADYNISSSFNDSVLEQKAFKKSHHENIKPLLSRDSRLSATKKQSAEKSSTNRYLNVKSTSFSNRASPVTKEFQKVSSVLQSQGLKYTKASSSKVATELPPAESNLERHAQNGDKKRKVETIPQSYSRDSSIPVNKETVRKATDGQPAVNVTGHIGDAKGEFLQPTEKEAVIVRVESSSKPELKHIQVISDFVLEDQQNFVEAQNKDNDTLVSEKHHQEKIDFEVPLANDDHLGKEFKNIDEEHIIEKQELTRQIVSCQRVYVEKEELVEPLEYQNMETSIKVNKEEIKKVQDFSKPNAEDLDELNVPSSDDVSHQGIEYSLSQELDFDTQVSLNKADIDNAHQHKEDMNQELDERNKSLQLNKNFELSHTEETSDYGEAKVDLQDEEVIMDQKSQVLSSPKEDSNQLFDDEQNLTKDIHAEQKNEMEEYNERPEKDTKEIPQDTNIEEYCDNELDQKSSRQDEDILEVDQLSVGKSEYTKFDQERQEGLQLFVASESMGHLLNEEDFKTESKKDEKEDYEDDYECEENVINSDQNIEDSIDIEQSRMLVVKEVHQSTNQALDDFEEIQLQSQEEKNNLEFNDLEQESQNYEDQQRTDIVKAPQEITQEFSNANQGESGDQKNKDIFDQMDNLQNKVNQLPEYELDSLQLGPEDLKSMELSDTEQESQQIGGDYIENKQVVQTLDSDEGNGLLDIHPHSKPEELRDLVWEESMICNEEGEDIQQFKKEIEQSVESQSVQLAPERHIESAEESQELKTDGQSLENYLIEEEEGDIKTNTAEMKNSELKAGEQDKEGMIEDNYEICTTDEYTKSITTEVIVQSIHEECESYEEDNVYEKEGLIPADEEEDRSIPEHKAEKEQKRDKEHYQVISMEDKYQEYQENEKDRLPVQQESDIELNIAKEDGSLLQETEPIVEGQSEVSTNIKQDNIKLDDAHQDLEVAEDQPSDIETRLKHEDLVQSDGEKGHEEGSKVTLSTEEYTASKESETQQSIGKDYDVVEDAQASTTQGSKAENEPQENSSFQEEVEEGKENYHQQADEEKEGYHQELEEGKENSHQEFGQESSQKNVEGKEGYYQDTEEGKEDYPQDIAEEKEGYHQEGQEGMKVISTLNENVASEENKGNQPCQKDSDEDQYLGFSLKVIPNNLRFTSENDAEAQPEQPEQRNKLPDNGSETYEDEIHVHEEEFENLEQNNYVLEEKEKPEIFESEIICQQSTFLLEQESENLILGNSKSHVAFSENPTEKYDSDGPTVKHLTELDEMESTSNADNEYSKSEDSMDSQDISIFSQKSEELEISKDYQLEQTLPDTTPLPNLDDEFEDLAEDKIILPSQQSAEANKSQSPADDGEAEELLDSSLESQSSQILPEVNEQSNLIKGDDNVSDYNEQQEESPKGLLESEVPEHSVDTKLDTEDTFATLDIEEPVAEPSEDAIDSKMDNENSESEESTTSQEEVAIFSAKIDEFEASKYFQLEKTQFEISPQEDRVQLSSKQLVSESVDEDHKEEPLDEDRNTENLLTETIDFVPSSEQGETELVASISHEDTTENEDYIIKEHSDLVTQEFGLEQTESADIEDHKIDFYMEENKECDADPIDDGAKEPLTKCLDEINGDNAISSNVPDILNEEPEVQNKVALETYDKDVKLEVKPSEESSENDDSVTSDESSPNVSTISYAPEQEQSKSQCSEKADIVGDTDSKNPKELEESDLLLTSESVPEASLMENVKPQTSSGEERDIPGERRDSSSDSNKEHEVMSKFMKECNEDVKTVNGVFGHTIVQATLDLDNHLFNGNSTGRNSEIVISEAKTIVRLDGDIINSQSQEKINDSVIEFTMSEGKSEGLFQSLLETSEHKESRFDEASEIKNIMQAAVKYVDSDAEQSQYTKKIINPYLSERDLDDPSEITSSGIDEDLVNTKQEVNETNQGFKINQEQEDSWSSDE
ncbi:hypothetical protein GDO78_018757 [Eleutherodactylus coqui]|uniref:IF rod domain-containing protein n=1 Tax=Eleutherodactylus coqui TaxID=57060 RepID=A0A8J6EJR7_ELECQ|nr:hypothetical protein GDO78_018757 [Eleutherodactylus coqui]